MSRGAGSSGCTTTDSLNPVRTGLCGVRVPIYYCPSDQGLGADQDDPSLSYPRTRGNYVVNWGQVKYPGSGGATPAPSGQAKSVKGKRSGRTGKGS